MHLRLGGNSHDSHERPCTLRGELGSCYRFFFHYLSGERVLGCGLIGAIPVSFNFPLVESEYSCVYSYLLPSTRPTNGAIQVLYAIVEELTAQALASLQ